MSADTPEGREAEVREVLEAIGDVLMIQAGMTPERANTLAWEVYNALPQVCDFDCDSCRDQENTMPEDLDPLADTIFGVLLENSGQGLTMREMADQITASIRPFIRDQVILAQHQDCDDDEGCGCVR